MNALVLGGNSPRYKDWVRQVAEALRPHFDDVQFVDYRHWEHGGDIDVAHELARAANAAAAWRGEYALIAKSIGTVITALGVAQHALQPAWCVFLGLPLNSAVKAAPGVASGFAELPPTVVVQNEHDPLGPFQEVEAYISKYGNKHTTALMLPGDTHDYTDLTLIAQLAGRRAASGTAIASS